ncbi:recombination regulator RecX [Caviibacterium pharyngocola]|uniref:Regulatory protein RecX n=1 Tax=Caviibacterium pharyngocola TaxID=28159 RepID=A0A2M8RU97_9PAST|nr:recombination regulator RecX [Caviibacterium pharyngocola]PJG82459.1 recombination regulator RecX [Caviibacterium pharyngocola]
MSSLSLGYVLNLLAKREYSEFELRCKMQEKAFSEQEIEQTLAHCRQKNWQNDRRFTENYLYMRSQRGYGVQRIKQELRQLKGIQADLINEVLDESEIDWTQIALSVLQKKFPQYRTALDLKTKQKIWRYMLSHGFSPDDFADAMCSSHEDD